MKPVTNLTKKGASWRWSEAELKAFNQLKALVTESPALALYDSNAETDLHTDASKHGVARILMQRQANGDLKPVIYYSRATTGAKQSWHSYELETDSVAVRASTSSYS